MSATLNAARVAAALNVALLAALVGLLARNYRVIRSKQTLGTAVFAALLLAENSLAFYYYNFADIPSPRPRSER